MRKFIGEAFKRAQDPWAREDARYLYLAERDAILDGEFYDVLLYPFYQETTGGMNGKGKYVPICERRPAVQFNLPNMIADQTSRKTFGGSNAPTILHAKKTVGKKIRAIRDEADLESKMVEAMHWGSVGSVASVFQIVPFTQAGKKQSKVVVTNYRSRQCTPAFNKLGELSSLRIHYPIQGSEFRANGIQIDVAGEDLVPEESYWCVFEFDTDSEWQYAPIKLDKWKPLDGDNGMLRYIERTKHGLGFVPASWAHYRTGKIRTYDGRCFWDACVPTIIDFDYTVSQIGGGIRYNSVPQVVVKGNVINSQQDGGLGRGASRFLQIKHDIKEGDVEESNAEVYMLEAKGEGMKVGLQDYAPLGLRIAMQQICASLKDPNKLTTAMSGKGMEILESEYYDLVRELRTVFGEQHYLKFLKKICVAASMKNHALAKGLSTEDIDGAYLGWPPLSSVGAIEFQALSMGLSAQVEAGIMDIQEAHDYSMAQIDMPAATENKDYLPTLEKQDDDEAPPKKKGIVKTKPNQKNDDAEIDQKAQKLAHGAAQAAARGPLDTKLGP